MPHACAQVREIFFILLHVTGHVPCLRLLVYYVQNIVRNKKGFSDTVRDLKKVKLGISEYLRGLIFASGLTEVGLGWSSQGMAGFTKGGHTRLRGAAFQVTRTSTRPLVPSQREAQRHTSQPLLVSSALQRLLFLCSFLNFVFS